MTRKYLPKVTLSSLFDDQLQLCKTLELPWMNNKKGKSCIPPGIYFVTKEDPIPKNDPLGRRERPYKHFRVHGVKGRGGILIHIANHTRQILGCIVPGYVFNDFDKDGIIDITQSKPALEMLVEYLPNEFYLEIGPEVPMAA